MEQVGILVHGSEDLTREVVIDLCCQRDTPQGEDPLQDLDDEYDARDDDDNGEDGNGEDDNGEDDDDEDADIAEWDAKFLNHRYPQVFFLPLFDGIVKGTRDVRSGLIVKPVDGRRGVYKRIGVCFDGCDSKDNPNDQQKKRLPRPMITTDVVEHGLQSELYLGAGDTLLQLI